LAGWTLDELARIEESVVAEVDEAAKRALASPPPSSDELFTDVYCGSDTSWRN
jgi:TPP-dependent pyruvate/acetoin dehydrogenase alpha subunit